MALRILIIEDFQPDYKKLVKILDKYEVEYFPKPEEFVYFSQLLLTLAQDNDKVAVEEEISGLIQKFKPECILLDKNLNFPNTSRNDNTGELIKERILDKHFPGAAVCVLSRSSTGNKLGYATKNDMNYIYKLSKTGLEGELFVKVFKPHEVALKPSINDNQKVEDSAPASADNLALPLDLKKDSSPQKSEVQENKLAEEMEIPLTLQFAYRKFFYKIFPWLQMSIDLVIILSFLLLFVTAIGLGGIYLFSHMKHFEPIKFAEHSFVCFLPALIIFGFYVFYIHALQPYVNSTPITIIDFENPSKLLMLTKKLFISSLVSYLFTKIVEIIDASIVSGKGFSYQDSLGISTLVQLGVIVVVILILIGFYMYLSSHKDSEHH